MNTYIRLSDRWFSALVVAATLLHSTASAETPAGTAVAAPASGSPQRPVGILRGVTLAPGGFSLAAVHVVIRNAAGGDQELTSDADGIFIAKDLQPGTYRVTASKDGFTSPAARTVLVVPNKTSNTSVQLALGVFGSLRGVTLAPGGFSLEGVSIAVRNVASSTDSKLVSDADGIFRVTDLPPGQYQITATRAGYASPAAITVEVAQNKIANASIELAQLQPSAQPVDSGAVTPAPGAPPAVDTFTPFAFADFSWLNGNDRTHDSPLDSKYITGEFRADTHYALNFNQPRDHTIGGSSEVFRSGEVQLEQMSLGATLHVGNVRGRLLTMFGMFATTTQRNDASSGVGQWDVRTAYRNLAEAYGGYHFNVNHGLNVDAGIFASYVGLFSYYNFDNWAYQPSYVSSNTPWYFNGVRVQWFPTNKLKIEPWFINGWQAYNRFNGKPGVGGQIRWAPKDWLVIVANQYGIGTDTLGVPKRARYHTDDSIEVKYYDKPDRYLDKMAFTFTGDLGCESGGGVSCTGKGGVPKQAFLGWMLYNRVWFKKDLWALTLGGGGINNTGRYLVLVPPVNGADAVSGTPYFQQNPGSKFKAWDTTATLDLMPKQFITFRLEFGYRHTNIPYWTGRGGITPPGGNNGAPQNFVCSDGANSGTSVLSAAEAACGGGRNSVWFPDFRRGQALLMLSILVKL